MSREKILFRSEVRQGVKEVAAYLRQLADRVESQQVTLSQGADEITLDLPGTIELGVKVEEKVKGQKGNKFQLEVELEWYEGQEEEGPLTIS